MTTPIKQLQEKLTNNIAIPLTEKKRKLKPVYSNRRKK